MKRRSIGIAGITLILAALALGMLGPRLWPSAFWSGTAMRPGMMSGLMNGPGMMSGGMMNGSMMSGGMMGRTVIGEASTPFDQRLLDQMIVHHQGAVMSAQMMIADSARPELRDLAQRIIVAQQREIDQMRGWRQEWYGATSVGPMPGMMGGGMISSMMSRDQMRQMMGASTDFDRMFLQMMIPHHEAAIAMAQQALEQAQHPEVKTLAQSISTTQRAEIDEMQGYLRSWYSATSQ
jgi:uncharacterized protein (DUF305 family)